MLLSELGALLLRECPGASWYRYGGDEFLGIFRETSVADVRGVVDRLRQARRDIAFSAGAAPGGASALVDADRDLYRAKREA